MNHRERFEELLNGYAEQTLTTEEHAELELLFREAPDWREEAEQERELVAMLSSLRATKAPAALHDAVLAGAASADIQPVEVRKSARSLGLWQLGAAAAIFLAGLVVYNTHEPSPLPLKSGSVETRTRMVELDAGGRKESANELATAAGTGRLKIAQTDRLLEYNPTEGTFSAGDVWRAGNPDGPDTSVNKLADATKKAGADKNEGAVIDSEPQRKDLSTLKEDAAPKQLTDERTLQAAPAPASAAATKPESDANNNVSPTENNGAFKTHLYFDRSPSYGNAVPEKGWNLKEAEARDSSDSFFLQIPSQIAANFSQLPTRQQIDPVIIANGGSVVVDTPWYKTATEYLSEGAAYSQLGYASNTRYLVVDFDKAEEATKTQQQVTQKTLPQDVLQLARVGDDTRVLIPYQAGQAIQFQDAPLEPAKPADDQAKLFAKAKKAEAAAPPASAASAVSVPGSVQEARRQRGAAQLPTPRSFGTFDEFDAYVRRLGAQFLFYTADRVLAFTEEAPSATAQTPTADKPFTGYLVYHFAQAAKADAAIQQLVACTGEGIRNVGVTDAELVRQPDGVRLIIPYRIEQNR